MERIHYNHKSFSTKFSSDEDLSADCLGKEQNVDLSVQF